MLQKRCGTGAPDEAGMVLLLARVNLLHGGDAKNGIFDPAMSKKLLARLESLPKAEVASWTKTAAKAMGADAVTETDMALALVGMDPLFSGAAYKPDRAAKYKKRLAGFDKESLARAVALMREKLPRFAQDVTAPGDPVFALVSADIFFNEKGFDAALFESAAVNIPAARAGLAAQTP
jgi:hypothetical protein